MTHDRKVFGRLLVEVEGKRYWIELRKEGLLARRFRQPLSRSRRLSFREIVEVSFGQKLLIFG